MVTHTGSTLEFLKSKRRFHKTTHKRALARYRYFNWCKKANVTFVIPWVKRIKTCKYLKTHLKRTLSLNMKADIVCTGSKLSSKLNVKIKNTLWKNSMTFSTEVFVLQTTVQKIEINHLVDYVVESSHLPVVKITSLYQTVSRRTALAQRRSCKH